MEIDLSTLPGLHARPYRGPVDHPAMAEMMTRWYAASGFEGVATVAEVDHTYAHLEHCDPLTDMVMVESADGRLAGYTRTEWQQVEGGERKYFVFAKLDPDWVGTDLAAALLEANRARARAIASGHAVDCPKLFEGWSEDDRERILADAYRAMGFRPVTFGATMVRSHLDDVPATSLPAGLKIRPVHESHLRAIWEADKEAFRDHWGYSEPTEEDWERFLGFPHRDESLWKVAWEGDRVVGQVRSFINRAENDELGLRRGWTEFISTARDWRKRGVARALICESLRELKDRGMSDAALGVHTENPTGAFHLYESLGYEVQERYTTFQQPVG
jgi:mycothiol synthase